MGKIASKLRYAGGEKAMTVRRPVYRGLFEFCPDIILNIKMAGSWFAAAHPSGGEKCPWKNHDPREQVTESSWMIVIPPGKETALICRTEPPDFDSSDYGLRRRHCQTWRFIIVPGIRLWYRHPPQLQRESGRNQYFLRCLTRRQKTDRRPKTTGKSEKGRFIQIPLEITGTLPAETHENGNLKTHWDYVPSWCRGRTAVKRWLNLWGKFDCRWIPW